VPAAHVYLAQPQQLQQPDAAVLRPEVAALQVGEPTTALVSRGQRSGSVVPTGVNCMKTSRTQPVHAK